MASAITAIEREGDPHFLTLSQPISKPSEHQRRLRASSWRAGSRIQARHQAIDPKVVQVANIVASSEWSQPIF